MMRAVWLCLTVLAVVLFGGAAGGHEQWPPYPDFGWALLTHTEGGSISITRGLTEYECEFARNRALGLPATDEERQADMEERQAFMASIDAIDELREAWAEENNCRNWGQETILDSYVLPDGQCAFGHGLRYPYIETFLITERSIKYSECFISPDR